VTNFVMLELGQPLHGFDNARVEGTIRPRLALPGETLVLLDGKSITLNPDTMVVSDDSGAIGLAGIMGGLDTAVTDETTDVFFEAAFWPPATMAGRARAYGLQTDASQRFERGVDPSGQARAVERASELLLQIAGGQAGPLTVAMSEAHMPEQRDIRLRSTRLADLLGVEIGRETVRRILSRLEFETVDTADGWRVRVPRHRFDVEREADLIEEVARIHGYDRIPEATGAASMPLAPVTESRVAAEAAAALLAARDFREVITYSFVDADDDALVSGKTSRLVLSNPIASDMSVMRSSLWSGMLRACAGNLARQQERVRMFEIGKSFDGEPTAPRETQRVAGLVCGPRQPEQWGSSRQEVDFFDIKCDVMALLGLGGAAEHFEFVATGHPALQAGQAAVIRREGEILGVVGKLDPRLARHFDIKRAVYLFELDADMALAAQLPVAESISRFPAIRRDIALLVAEKVTAGELVAAVRAAAPTVVRSVRIFDVYRGPGVEAGLKSVAIGLILQETSRTLTDEDADAAQTAAVQKLSQEFAAVLRDE
jgi:phenylalanyl-tRNA synthetase beta chain